MVDQPLQPFSAPASFGIFLPDGISAGTLVEWFAYIIFVAWAIYTAVVVYHWLKYSHGSLLAFPAIATHMTISLLLVIYALSGTLVI